MSGLSQRPGGEPEQVQQPAAQQGRLREDGPAQDGRPQDDQGAAQGAAAGGGRQGGRSAPRRGHHHTEHSEVRLGRVRS